MKMEEEIRAKRDLGEGRWDKILKRKMVELSSCDNYEEARDEWEATGNVYRHSHRGNEPEWTNGHVGFCLCGHRVVYHFEIRNTVTGVHECVGSDHIGAYLIIQQMVNELGISMESITDKMIDDWMQKRLQTMKSNAWWEEHGEHFNEMFDEIKELDAVINNKNEFMYLHRNSDDERYYDWHYDLKTRATGKFGDYGYQMASIVWRWNHEDNTKNQLLKYGYPNDRLWADLNLFYALRDVTHRKVEEDHKQQAKDATDSRNRQQEAAKVSMRMRVAKQEEANRVWAEGAKERERLALIENERMLQDRLLREQRRKLEALTILMKESQVFNDTCDYYGFPPFTIDSLEGKGTSELFSFSVIKQMIMDGEKLQPHHLDTLQRHLGGE